jgi:tumor protein p53-inducible protein 3
MRAVVASGAGGPEVLSIGQVDRPEPAPEEILVRVHATALNRADLLQRDGKYPPPPGASPLLGLEVAGDVVEVGRDAIGWQRGDRVCALLPGGGYAEYASFDGGLAMAMPAGLSYQDAAAIPEVFLTAHQALFWIGKLEADHTALIHAGGSGVGTAAIQLARRTGAIVITTASEAKLDTCLGLGADHAIDYRKDSFAARVEALTEGRGVDVILDFIGAAYLDENLRALATDGRLVMLAAMGGARTEVNLGQLLRKRGTITASTLRSRDLDYRRRLVSDFRESWLSDFETGRLKPVIDSTFDLADIADAHERMEANLNIGKIVVRV